MSPKITHAKNVQQKSRTHRVRQIRPNWYQVFDPATGQKYDVALGKNGGTCSCPWGQHRPARDHRSGCSHVIAAMAYRAARQGLRISVWNSRRAARRQHRPMLDIGDGLILTRRHD
ncbi:MAG: hypothetical protein Kow0031_18930 [Anaerolineae bacterium]